MPRLSSRASTIATFYSEILGRFPDANGFNLLLNSTLDDAGIANLLRNSNEGILLERAIEKTKQRLTEFPNKKKLLLLGAYGNGNLGDLEMADVIARDLEDAYEVACFSHSPLAVMDYTFDEHKKLDATFFPLNPRVLQLFDGLIIGGGGFLAWPHDPIWHPAWAYLVPIPFVILAVGVGHPLDERLHNLVARSFVASARDLASVEDLARIQPKAELCPDPILSLVPQRTYQKDPSRPFTRVFVVRGAPTAWHQKVRDQLQPTDLVVFFEKIVDQALFGLFPEANVVDTIEAYLSLVAKADLVVTERYHGAILALLCGCPTIGVYRGDHNSSKIVSFFETLGISQYCSSDPNLSYRANNFPCDEVAAEIEVLKSSYKTARTSIISRLLETKFA